MSILIFQTLLNSWFLLLVVPLVLFYFLKLKRPKQIVSSLVLWQQVMNDKRVNSPFARFKRHLLLLLQLLLLIFLILSSMKPILRGGGISTDYLPILIDNSASMGALNTKGKAALDEVKEQVMSIIERLPSHQHICLISFNRTACRLTPFTNNITVLKEALAEIQIEDIGSDLENVLRLTQGLTQSTYIERIKLFSDGNFPESLDFDLPFFIDFHQIDEPVSNIGITDLNAQLVDFRTWHVFIRLVGSENSTGPASLDIFQDNQKVESQLLNFDHGNEQSVLLTIQTDRSTTIKAVLEVDGDDALEADNIAYIDIPEIAPLSVYTPSGLPFINHIFARMNDITVDNIRESSSYDLIVSDNQIDFELNGTVRLFINIVPTDLHSEFTIKNEIDEVVDWDRRSNLLKHVSFNDLLILQKPVTSFLESDLENNGFDVLIHGSQGPLLLKTHKYGSLDYFLMFHPHQSTFPYRIGFPIFFSNLTGIVRRDQGIVDKQGFRTGILPELKFKSNSKYTIVSPDGEIDQHLTDENGNIRSLMINKVGLYSLKQGDNVVRKIGVSLFDEQETRLVQVSEMLFADDVAVVAGKEQEDSQMRLWKFLSGLAFVLLLIEWWIFHKPPRLSRN